MTRHYLLNSFSPQFQLHNTSIQEIPHTIQTKSSTASYNSRKSKINNLNSTPIFNDKLYRADITDINGNYLAKTVKSIDIGIKTSDVINKKKLFHSNSYFSKIQNKKNNIVSKKNGISIAYSINGGSGED